MRVKYRGANRNSCAYPCKTGRKELRSLRTCNEQEAASRNVNPPLSAAPEAGVGGLIVGNGYEGYASAFSAARRPDVAHQPCWPPDITSTS